MAYRVYLPRFRSNNLKTTLKISFKGAMLLVIYFAYIIIIDFQVLNFKQYVISKPEGLPYSRAGL